MDNLVSLYLEELKQRRMSQNTLDAYFRDINRFSAFLVEREETLAEVNVITVMAYVQQLQKFGKANSSIIRNIISLRNFYKYLFKKGYVKDNPIIMYEIPKVSRNLPEILSYEEMDILLNKPDLNSNKGIRDKAMLEVMYAGGLKVSELINLKLYDINLKFSYIKCVGAKHKERIIPIGSYACRCIEEYLKIRDKINVLNYDFLFLNMQGIPMSRQGFWKIIRYYAKESNINKAINTFTLRHSCAVHMLQNGADIKLIQEMLGHHAMAATQVYVSMSKKSKLSEVYRNTHPRA